MSEIYEFGRFRLEVTERRLLREGRPVRLRAKVLDTLGILVRNGGHLLTKDELIQAVWPDTAVEENNLAHNVAALRKALGETATGERYIETVPGKGYRFAEAVRAVTGDGSAAQTGSPRHPVRYRSSPRLVHREQELAWLHALLEECAQRIRRTVFITGETGIGKTSLVRAFLREAAARHETIRIASGQCLEHHGPGEPYLPLLEAVTALCRQPGGEEVVRVLTSHAPSWLAQMPRPLEEDAAAEVRQRAVGATRERMLREMVDAIEVLSTEAPLVLFLEDLHWSDYSTLDLVDRLARRDAPCRLLLIGTYHSAGIRRQDRSIHSIARELAVRRRCEQLPLTFLSAAAVREYLGLRFSGAPLPESLARSLHERSEGNPLFMESIVDSWITQGLLSKAGGAWRLCAEPEALASRIPESLRGFIEQQFECFDPADREILEAAGVAGVEFTAAAVAAALNKMPDAEDRCDLLARQGLFLRRAGIADWPDGTASARYAFVHNLYRQVLYDQIPPARRAHFHLKIGSRVEKAYGSNAPEIAPVLAAHFVAGRDAKRAVSYLHLAARQALRRSAHREALDYLNRGLGLLRSVADGHERARCELGLRITAGPPLIATKGWKSEELEHTYVRARELCEELDDADQLYPVLFGLSALREFRGEYKESEEIMTERLRLCPGCGDGASLEAHVLLACSLFHQGEFNRALEHADRGLEIYSPARHLELIAFFGENPGVACHDWGALALWFLGYPDRAIRKAERALELAHDPAHVYSLASAHMQVAFIRQFRREPHSVRRMTDAAMALATAQGFPSTVAKAMCLTGWSAAVLGDGAAGVELLRRGLKLYRDTGAEMDRPYFLGLLAEALGQTGQPVAGLTAIAEALEMVRASRSFFHEAELHRLRGTLLCQAAAERSEEAIAAFQQSLEIARRQNARSLELRAAVSLAQLPVDAGIRGQVVALLGEIYSRFAEGFDTPDLRQARAILQPRRAAAL